jgi:ferric-dicitrate binding protein FerR (iron transport regulator)
MNNASEKIKRILDEYFASPLSDALDGRIRNWLVDDRHRDEKERALEELWNERVGYEETPGKFARRSVDRVVARIGFGVPRKARLGRIFQVAAVLIPLIVLGGEAVWFTGRQQIEWVTLVADAGVQEQFELPDGSEVWLNPNGEVSYPEKFKNREVKLAGDAFFDVVKNDDAPFTVTTGELSVTVHGTRFQVDAYGDKDRSTVTLHSGSVAVEAGDEETVLEPGNQLQYYREEGSVSVHEVALGEWGKPSLDFYDATLEDIFFSLEQNYDVDLRVDGLLPGMPRYTIRFAHGQPVDEILTILARLTRAFTREAGEGDQINITLTPH